jgi:putative ATP-dependent endonuclease of the OLD family
MKLIELSIENFYGFEKRTTINVRDFNVLVGRNDVGKSLILKALDLFLNDKTPSIDVKNLNNESSEIIIEAVFDAQDQKIIIDETIETTFESEELIDQQGYL